MSSSPSTIPFHQQKYQPFLFTNQNINHSFSPTKISTIPFHQPKYQPFLFTNQNINHSFSPTKISTIPFHQPKYQPFLFTNQNINHSFSPTKISTNPKSSQSKVHFSNSLIKFSSSKGDRFFCAGSLKVDLNLKAAYNVLCSTAGEPQTTINKQVSYPQILCAIQT